MLRTTDIRILLAILISLGGLAARPCLAGTVWAWGDNYYGELGNAPTPTANSSVPVGVSGLSGVTAIAAGGAFSIALKTNGTVWAWGGDTYGEQGNGSAADSGVPVEVNGLSGVAAIAAGGNDGLALETDGTVRAWGHNDSGQLGNGTTINSSMPVEVSGLSGVTAITAGGAFSLALKTDGTVWAWGDNYNGELGNGTTVNSSVPVEVSGLSGVTTIAAGGGFSLALKTDGSVWAWGYNIYGELGNGSTTDSSVPVEVSGLSGVTVIAAGGGFSLALKTDGSVWAWGYNGYGELGNGSTLFNITVPVEVSGLSSVTAVTGGTYHSLALKSDGTVWAWGNNQSGQLGNGTTTNSSIPVEVSGLSGVTAIAAGGAFSLAMVGDTTAPATTASLSGPAGQNGWYAGPVTVTLSATDPDGPSDQLVTYYSLDGGTLQTYTAPFIISGDARHTLSFWSEDHAGNHEATQTLNIPIDSTPPTLSFGSPSPAAKADGWNSSAVAMAYTTADNISGVASAAPSSPLQFTTEGKNQTRTVKVTDVAGNSATFTSPPVNIDLTPPVTTLTFTGPAGSDSSSFTGPVQVKLSAADNLSGVSATYYTVDGGSQQTYTQPFTIAADGKHTLTFRSEDIAGNQEAARTQALLVDTSIPAITITSPQSRTYLLNQVVIASYTSTDAVDGIVTSAGPVPSGSPIDTASVGTKTFTVNAADNAGNTSQASVTYTVSYGVKLLYDSTKGVAPGTPLPVSLELVDAAGANVSSGTVSLQAVSVTLAGDPASPGSGSGPSFAFDPQQGNGGAYLLPLDTTGLQPGQYNLNFMATGDPTLHSAAITISGTAGSLPTGLVMLSLPYSSSDDLASLLGLTLLPDGAADIATYDPVGGQYLQYPHLPGPDGKSAVPGRGYWALEKGSHTLQPAQSSPNASPMDLTLPAGWNMIGDPYPYPLPVSSLQVVASGTPESFSAAVTAGIVGSTIWTWDNVGGQYVAATTLSPYEGYWIYVAAAAGQAITLRLANPGFSAAPQSESR
ncbi:MAG TPA: hypothetical protein VFJ58_04340 [Armatimonadota bacterium]|nr:hypothetical protein [Armatimonadota bacterium]